MSPFTWGQFEWSVVLIVSVNVYVPEFTAVYCNLLFSTQLQWLPQKWQVQWLFLVYRWVLALYYLAWLIVAGVQATGPTFFIYLTNWALIMWVVYLLTAAVSSTTNFFQVNFCCKNKFAVDSKGPRKPYELLISTPVGCCGVRNDGISWYQKIHWFLFTVALLLLTFEIAEHFIL